MRTWLMMGPVAVAGVIALAVLGPSETVRAVGTVLLLAFPLALSAGALLDIARRPRWAWALADRGQVAWMGAVMVGVLVVPLGLVISLMYLIRVRPQLRAVEEGRF